MRSSCRVSSLTFVFAALLFAMSFAVHAADVPRMSTDELKSRIGEADLVVLDVRSGRDWSQSGQKILSSERVNPGAVNQWVDHYPKDKVMVLYCA